MIIESICYFDGKTNHINSKGSEIRVYNSLYNLAEITRFRLIYSVL